MISTTPPTKAEWMFLRDLKGLDDIQQGMLEPSRVTVEAIRTDQDALRRLFQRGYVRVVAHGAGPRVYFLTTKGLRALQRHHQRRDP